MTCSASSLFAAPVCRDGPRRATLLDLMRVRDLSADELAASSGLPRREVAAELRVMESLGLATRRKQGATTWNRTLTGLVEFHQLLKAGVI